MSFNDSEQQARVELASSVHPQPSTTALTAPLDPNKQLSVSVITRRRTPLSLEALGGKILSQEAFEQQYGADPADFEALRAFASEHGLSVNEARSSLARRTLVLEGPAAQMEQAFGVSLHSVQPGDNIGGYHCYTGMLSVPQQHAPRIESVLGLDSRPIAKSHLRWGSGKERDGNIIRASAAFSSFSPVQVAELYGFPSNLTGAGQTIGIVELGGGYEISDITSYFDGLGLTPPSVVAVSVDGGTNVPGSDPNGADGEVALDIQVAGAVANGAKIAVYFTPNTDQGFIDAITTAVHDTTNKPSVLSISWGGPETGWSAASRTSLDNACQSAAALGVTITVAAGDNGSSDGQSGNTVDFPASSPHVLACGGTALKGEGSTITSEVVWNDQSQGGGATEPKPSGGSGGRGVPDVSGDASPETGYNILVDGQQGVVGGTSAVAPLWAGLIALVNQARVEAGESPVGFVNAQLYATPSALRDITSGTNGSYQAAKGWDACTGLGSPNGAAVLAALQK